jgi:hypothetical protein
MGRGDFELSGPVGCAVWAGRCGISTVDGSTRNNAIVRDGMRFMRRSRIELRLGSRQDVCCTGTGKPEPIQHRPLLTCGSTTSALRGRRLLPRQVRHGLEPAPNFWQLGCHVGRCSLSLRLDRS